jgi:hypothetical protein
LRDTAEVLDEVALRARIVAEQGGAEQSTMRLFDRDALCGRATAKLFHDSGFDVTDEELRHGENVLSMIAEVKAK